MKQLFAWVWRKRLEPGDRVVRVKGWRTCLLDTQRGRMTVEFLFSWEKQD